MLHLENIFAACVSVGYCPSTNPPYSQNVCFQVNGFVHGAENKKRLFSEAQIWINVSIKVL